VNAIPMDTSKALKPARQHPAIDRLSPEVRRQLDERIARRDFKNYKELKRWLGQRGCIIATVSVRRHVLKIERRIEAVRLATAEARAVVNAAGSDDLEINQTLMRLVQQHLFDVLVELNIANLRGGELAALARTVATLARASIAQQKYADQVRVRVLAAQRTVAEAQARGLTEEGVGQIKRVLMEITG